MIPQWLRIKGCGIDMSDKVLEKSRSLNSFKEYRSAPCSVVVGEASSGLVWTVKVSKTRVGILYMYDDDPDPEDVGLPTDASSEGKGGLSVCEGSTDAWAEMLSLTLNSGFTDSWLGRTSASRWQRRRCHDVSRRSENAKI